MEGFAILFRKEIQEYDFGPGHPFHRRKGEEFLNFLKEKKEFPILKAEKASNEDLELICQKDYIEFTKNYFERANLGESYPEGEPSVSYGASNGKFFQYHSADNLPREKPGKIEEAARYIIGQAKLACDLVWQGKFKKIISVGGGLHHAKKNFGEGFCLYNDVAFCARYLLEKYNLKRILILDTDAHGGNGTMEYFYQTPKVLLIDLHQDPRTLYPGTGFMEQIGEGKGRGFTINIPLPMFAGYDSYKLTFEEIVEPVVKEFEPQIIIRNGGSDPHFADELTQLGLTVEGFRMLGEKVKNLAKICDDKLIDLIASGYNQKVLFPSWLALISGIIDVNVELKEPIPAQFTKDSVFEETKKMMKEIKKILTPYWRCFRKEISNGACPPNFRSFSNKNN